MIFPNKAGDHKDTDDVLRAELHAAGIQTMQEAEGKPSEFLAEYFRSASGEVKTSVIGVLHGWKFNRAWYYWVCEGPGIEVATAEKLHAEFGRVVRVDGDAGCQSPREAFHGLAVGCYHVDTPEGLKALADTIKGLCDTSILPIVRRLMQLEKEIAQLRHAEASKTNERFDEVLAFCSQLKREGRRVEATKLYRTKTGCGLREAYDFIDQLK